MQIRFVRARWIATLMAGALMIGAPHAAAAQEKAQEKGQEKTQEKTQDYVLVVSVDNPITTLTKKEVADIFLKRTTRWSDGKTVIPVDQSKGSRLRDVFSRAVIGQSTASVDSYWQTQIFSGKNVPPIVRGKDADVLALIRANPSAIGYVDSKTPLGSGVKAITVK